MALYGGIEAGGTKFNCIVASGPDDFRAEARISTTTPQETLGQVITFFKEQAEKGGEAVKAVGVGCFGPVDLNLSSQTYGYITTTPKIAWQNADVVGTLNKALGVPVAFDTDVNAAAIGEGRWGAAQGLDNFIYLTIGTGVGGGAIFNGKPIHGLVHPEMGHIRLMHDWQADPFPGICPYHGDCFEGMTAGPAMKARWNQPAETLSMEHPAWALEAHYIALALSDLICAFSPTRIILGGGVMQQEALFPMIRTETLKLLNDYVQSSTILKAIDQYIVPPGLGGRAGVLGSLALAMNM